MTAASTSGRVCALRQEYEAAYAEAQGYAADFIWQSITRGPGSAPDWIVWEFQRPGGGLMWRRGKGVTANGNDDEFHDFKWPT